MVTITNYKEVQTADGRQFVSIELQSEPKLVQSSTTGNFYLTVNKTRVTTALSVDVCKTLVGQQLPGTVEKIQVEPYESINKETGEVKVLHHVFVYTPDEQSVQKVQLGELPMMTDFNMGMNSMPMGSFGMPS
ncbi:hypothetical protein FACS1894179_08990 [Bacteroidia bacterium]|nr:hypothetical protein FACS1894169_12390 [Bacteroidia bacterium]GHV41236.1 hypothetical protein FACS1894179_08990 [Bacteroidia bacterium]